MALAQQLITGQNDEWALLRRHESEKHFGVQVAGGYPNVMVPTAEMLGREFSGGGVDFVDVNLGCPIDLVFNQGAGSARESALPLFLSSSDTRSSGLWLTLSPQ